MNTIYTINSCNSVTYHLKNGLLFLLKEWKTLLIIVSIGTAGSFVATAQTNETVTNKTVIQLCKAGIGKSIIIAKIENSSCNFDLSTNGLVQLKKGAVPDDIVTEMIAKSNAPAMPSAPAPGQSNMQGQNGNPELALQPGVYYFNPATNGYVMINPAMIADQQVAGTATYKMRALISGKIKGALNGLQANQKINDPNPLFVVVMDIGGQNAGSPTVPNLGDPSQILMVKLKQTRNDTRELVIGRASPSGYVQGVEETAKVTINLKKVQDGFYEATAAYPFITGEYSIVYALPDVNGQSTPYEAYDFSLKGADNAVVAGPRDPRVDRKPPPPPPNPLNLFRKKAKTDTTSSTGN
jgi:hypothetical protein